jgi:NADH-quinone oxidoreductase subunit C
MTEFEVIEVSRDNLIDTMKELSKEYDFLYSLVVVDKPNEKIFELNYLLARYSDSKIKLVRTKINREKPEVPSICKIFPSAEWEEREAYDMFGIVFTGHPDLRRILLPEDWPFSPPLRKDFVITDEIRNWTGTDLKWKYE